MLAGGTGVIFGFPFELGLSGWFAAGRTRGGRLGLVVCHDDLDEKKVAMGRKEGNSPSEPLE